MKNSLIILSLIVLSLIVSSCTKDEPQQYVTDPLTNLDALWTILDERYCYFPERGIDWDSVHTVYRKKVKTVRNVYQLYDCMAAMIDLLNDGHVNLYTSFDISSSTGWYDTYPTDFSSTILFSSRYLGTDYRRVNYLYYDTIGDIGYIYLNSFSSTVASSTMHYIDYYFRKCRGIIIDVRNNGGGDLTVSSSLAACFYTQKTHVGYIRHKTGTGHTDFSDPEPTYVDPADSLVDWSAKRVAVLINRRSYSATNDFVLNMSQAPNAVLVGGVTGGGGGMPLSQELPIGWLVRFSAVPMYDTNMRTTEFGIEPDVEIHISDENYDAGVDPIIDKAIEILHSNQ